MHHNLSGATAAVSVGRFALFAPFEALLDRMFVVEVGARASVGEVRDAIAAIAVGAALPPPPQAKVIKSTHF